jgi:hypothetical protein
MLMLTIEGGLALAEVQRQESLLKTGALQNAIFNSANFSSIATDAKGVMLMTRERGERSTQPSLT